MAESKPKMTHILYVNLSVSMKQPEITDLVSQHTQHNWKQIKKLQYLSNMPALYPRIGKSVFGFDNTSHVHSKWSMPSLDPGFCETFQQVTDDQCVNWLKQKSHRPWVVQWSGGIDSTLILCAILKNTSLDDRQNISVICDRAGVYENPRFFFNHVKPNFKILDTQTTKIQTLYDTHFVIDGHPADLLFCGQNGIAIAQRFPNILEKNYRTNLDQLLQYMEVRVDRSFAEWYYERMLDNICSVDMPIETVYDFWWWQFFNFTWPDVAVYYNFVGNVESKNPDTFIKFQANHLMWYATDAYQQWSMNNNNNNVKYGKTLAETKLPSKHYIHEFDRDDYYRWFKTKQDSLSKPSFYEQDILCVLDDFRILYTKDMALFLELLPQHIIN